MMQTAFAYSVPYPFPRGARKLHFISVGLVIGLFHLMLIMLFMREQQSKLDHPTLSHQKPSAQPLRVFMLQRAKHEVVDHSRNAKLDLPRSKVTQAVPSKKPANLVSATKKETENQSIQTSASDTPSANKASAIDHNIAHITKLLERELDQEERKREAAKPPNQLVREYWEKQNHPYQDKWQELSARIEKAAVARGPQEESYTLDDGSRITKINGVCYKAPDPGRAYLGQAEVRRVFCPRN